MNRHASILCCIAIVLCCAACQPQDAREEATATERTDVVSTEEEVTSIPAPSPTMTSPPPTSQATAASALPVSAFHTELLEAASGSTDTPLLGYLSGEMSDVLTLNRPDGTTFWELNLGPYLFPRSFSSLGFIDPMDISPNGEWLVVRHLASWFVDDSYAESKLSLVNVWTQEVRELPLYSENFPAGIDEAQQMEAVTAIQRALPRWSPDGQFLAYAAVLDGPSSDLYLYDLAADETTRLSFGANQLWLTPGWSPDGEWIVHEEWLGVYTDAGYLDRNDTIMAWAASTDGGAMVNLFDPFDPVTGGGHAFPAWIGAHDLVVYDYLYNMGFPAIRIDVSTGVVTPFTPYFGVADGSGVFYSLDVDPESGLAAFGAYPQQSSTSTNLEPGLYLQEVGREPIMVLDEDPLYPEWLDVLGVFYVRGESGSWLLHPDGSFLPLEGDYAGNPLSSPDGQWLLLFGGDGVQVFSAVDGALVFSVMDEEARWAMWEPGSGGFVFGTGWPEDGTVWRIRLVEPIVVQAIVVPPDVQTNWPGLLVWERGNTEK